MTAVLKGKSNCVVFRDNEDWERDKDSVKATTQAINATVK